MILKGFPDVEKSMLSDAREMLQNIEIRNNQVSPDDGDIVRPPVLANNPYEVSEGVAVDLAVVEKGCPLLDPSRGVRARWDTFLASIIIYSCLVVPYRMAFQVPAAGGWQVFEFCCDGAFFVDIILNFNTGESC